MTNQQRFKSTLLWMYFLFKSVAGVLAGRNRRFIVLMPPIFRSQFIYDRSRGKFIKVFIRNLIDSQVANQIFLNHDYDVEKSHRADGIRKFYRNIIASGKTPLIVDCGGNSGMATRYFRETYEEAFVVCIEPDPSNMDSARENNAGTMISFLLAGIGNADTKAKILDPGVGNWGYRVEACDEGGVEIISVNSILKRYESSKYVPFIMKIDIEGFEDNLFEAHTEWFDQFPMLVIELHDWMLPGQANSKNFLREVSSRNRDFVLQGENVFTVSNELV
jgi:FkbM family methyltransferase